MINPGQRFHFTFELDETALCKSRFDVVESASFQKCWAADLCVFDPLDLNAGCSRVQPNRIVDNAALNRKPGPSGRSSDGRTSFCSQSYVPKERLREISLPQPCEIFRLRTVGTGAPEILCKAQNGYRAVVGVCQIAVGVTRHPRPPRLEKAGRGTCWIAGCSRTLAIAFP